jgi:peptidoglycan/LPS O-acetylase OafA/YrhL
MKNKYYEKLDVVRLIAVIAVLLFHLNILKGGFLAVCIFFVLSGYLSAVSSFNKKKFSIKEYYIKKFKNIYLPLLIVVLLTVGVVSVIPGLNWINLKPETTSVLGGFNNFWQLQAEADYFTRHVNSPFTHFWFIAILLQFDLVYPIIYLLFKKMTEKINRLVPLIILGGITLISCVYFYICYKSNDLMFVYYNTFTRVYSLLLGVWLGYVNVYYDHLIPKFLRNKIVSNIIFYVYLIISIVLFFLIGSNSNYMGIMLLVSSLITMRLIDYGTLDSRDNKYLKSLASITYEVYLVQYPIIYIISNYNINNILRIFIIIVLVILLSILIKYILGKGNKIIRYTLTIIIIIGCIFGLYKYIVAEDHSKEMSELKEQLRENELLVLKKQEEYVRRMEKDTANKDSLIKKYENSEKALEDRVANANIVGVGDSVMLGAVGNLYKQFPNGYFDAQTSRTGWVANGILSDLKRKNMLGDIIIIGLGTNGDCPESIKENIMNTVGDRLVFWITVTNDKNVNVNGNINEFAKKYSNLYIIDWNSISKNHSEYFVADGIHLTEAGRKAYTKAIYDGIYNYYFEELQGEKETVLGKMEDAQRDNYSFYGNDLLLNTIDYLEDDFDGAKYITSKELTIDEVKEDILKDKENNVLNNNIVLMFDKNEKISVDEYKEIIELCEGKKVYIVTLDNELKDIKKKVTIINFNDYKKYLMVDKVHLTNEGNQELVNLIIEKTNIK